MPGNRVRLPTFAEMLLEALAKPLAQLLSERGSNSNNGNMLDAPTQQLKLPKKTIAQIEVTSTISVEKLPAPEVDYFCLFKSTTICCAGTVDRKLSPICNICGHAGECALEFSALRRMAEPNRRTEVSS
jgi:hypothetical protein